MRDQGEPREPGWGMWLLMSLAALGSDCRRRWQFRGAVWLYRVNRFVRFCTETKRSLGCSGIER
jgi:hypothetical protein